MHISPCLPATTASLPAPPSRPPHKTIYQIYPFTHPGSREDGDEDEEDNEQEEPFLLMKSLEKFVPNLGPGINDSTKASLPNVRDRWPGFLSVISSSSSPMRISAEPRRPSADLEAVVARQKAEAEADC
ncbi:hypothetical protein EDC01DRAFT_628266 [Geopyxis carbonaria]|nr:hypothetical protein EDC01DRAFT_628266 [Geopyxis carbonaria]